VQTPNATALIDTCPSYPNYASKNIPHLDKLQNDENKNKAEQATTISYVESEKNSN